MQSRSHVELITVYEICRILGASLDTTRTFRSALNVLTAHMGYRRAMVVMPSEDDDGTLKVHGSAGLSRDQEESVDRSDWYRCRWHARG